MNSNEKCIIKVSYEYKEYFINMTPKEFQKVRNENPDALIKMFAKKSFRCRPIKRPIFSTMLKTDNPQELSENGKKLIKILLKRYLDHKRIHVNMDVVWAHAIDGPRNVISILPERQQMELREAVYCLEQMLDGIKLSWEGVTRVIKNL